MSHFTKTRGYSLNIGRDRVVVEHRAAFRPRTIVILCTGFVVYCLIPSVREVLVEGFRSRDPIVFVLALFMLLTPIISGLTFFFFASGEVMRCDALELHFAKRRTLGRWHRARFAAQEIREMHWTSRGGGRARYYTVLTFRQGKRNYDMLENIDSESSNRILRALAGMGLDAYEDQTKMPSYKLRLRSDLP